MIVLGIDPGSHHTGYALIERLPTGGRLRVLEYGVINAKATDSLYERIGFISNALDKILEAYKPDLLSLEDCFVHLNARSALILGQARGAILATCHKHQVMVREFLPTAIKFAVAGQGRASKDSVAHAMQRHLLLKDLPSPADASDALAIAWVGAKADELSLLMPQLFDNDKKTVKRTKTKDQWANLVEQYQSK